MQSRMLRSAAVVTITALAAAGCENLSPGENAAAFGGGAAVLAGSFARAAGMSTAESFAVGAATGAVVAATVYVISKHQATERQRKIAEERAQAAYARIAARHREEQRAAEQHAVAQRKHTQTTGGGTATASTGTTGTSTTGGTTSTGAKKPTQTAEAKPVKPKPMPRYIAVETEKSANAAPQAKKSVMIWDTESHEVVGNDVYDVSKTPNVGSTAKFDTYTAEYVGSGS